jgi:putative hydrolase of the HAD superfamily
MNFPVVLFDLDDTLIVDEAASRAAYAETAREAGKFGAEIAPFERDVASLLETLWKENPQRAFCEAIGITHTECLWGDFATPSEPWEQLRAWSLDFRVRLFSLALRAQEIESEEAAEELAAKFVTVRRALLRLMPDALEMLARLAPSKQFGLVTNGEPFFQRWKMQSVGLAGFFRAVVVSGDEMIGKPDPRIFHKALTLLNASPESAVMVGNSLKRDIAGARAAGITCVWLKVAGAEEPAEVAPDFTISSLSELPGLLERIG